MKQSALILGATGGIGGAVSRQLTAADWDVTERSRRDGLDYDDPAALTACLEALEGSFDLIFITTGALEINGVGPEKSLRHLEADAMAAQFRVNTIGPGLVLAHAARLMPRTRPATVAALSARVGSIGDNRLGGWYSYRASKAALNQLIHSAAIELARSHRLATCVALHPGTVATRLTEIHGKGHDKVTPDEAATNLLRVLDGLGPEQTGRFFDWRGDEVVW